MIGGIAVLGMALVGVTVLMADVLVGATPAAIAPALGALVLFTLWGVVPLRIRRRPTPNLRLTRRTPAAFSG